MAEIRSIEVNGRSQAYRRLNRGEMPQLGDEIRPTPGRPTLGWQTIDEGLLPHTQTPCFDTFEYYRKIDLEESTRKVLLNVAVGTGHYQRSAERQARSLQAVGETCDRIARTDLPPGCPTHQEQPFAFKPYIFKEARDLGYTHALWLDSTCVVHKPLEAVWDAIDRDGAFFWNSGYMSGQWCSDRCLDGMRVTREEAWQIPMIQATVIGLRFDADRGFLDQWLQFVPLFHGAWKNRNHEVSRDPGVDGHRHDQSVASILVHRLGFPMVEPPICVYDGVTAETVFQNKGPG